MQRLNSMMIIPSCFSHPSTASTTTCQPLQQPPQSITTSVYQINLSTNNSVNSPMHLTLTWSKTTHLSHSLTICIPEHSFSITISLHQHTFSFFRTRPGSKSIHLASDHKIKLYWDFTRAKFNHNSAEPESCFYLALSYNGNMEFFLGDLQDELCRRTGLVMTRGRLLPEPLSRRDHLFGRRSYVSRVKMLGSKREIQVECGGGRMTVTVDGETKLVVKRLTWKFRGNEKFYLDGVEVEFYWDVFNWVNDNDTDTAHVGDGHGVFIFQVGEGGVWAEMMEPEKKLMRKCSSLVGVAVNPSSLSPCSSVLQWADGSSDAGRSSCSSASKYSCGSNAGFSFVMYAWRKD